MRVLFVLGLLNGLWFGLAFPLVSSLGALLFGLPIGRLPQWYFGLSSIAVVAGASGFTALLYPRLDGRWAPRPRLVLSPHATLMGDAVEGPVLRLQPACLTAEALEPFHDDVAVPRIELEQPCLAPGLLAGDQGRARAAERVEDHVPVLA